MSDFVNMALDALSVVWLWIYEYTYTTVLAGCRVSRMFCAQVVIHTVYGTL